MLMFDLDMEHIKLSISAVCFFSFDGVGLLNMLPFIRCML